MFSSHFLKIISLRWAPLEVCRGLGWNACATRRTFSAVRTVPRATRRLLVDNGCSSPELCNPFQYCLACRKLSIPHDVKISSKNTLCYVGFKKTFPQETVDALPTNAGWRPKASNRSTQRCVFHRAIYKDVGMALHLNRLIVSASPCTCFIMQRNKWSAINV